MDKRSVLFMKMVCCSLFLIFDAQFYICLYENYLDDI